MSDLALKSAKLKRDQLVNRRLDLHNEIAALDTEIGEIDKFIQLWHQFSADADSLTVDNSSAAEEIVEIKPKTNVNIESQSAKNSKKEDVANVARELILQHGKPMMREELYAALVGRGMVINGKDPYAVLFTMLWRMADVIARLPDGGYWPADKPNEEIGFDPAAYTQERRKLMEAEELSSKSKSLGISFDDVFG